jgi:hypothetical protein
MSSPKRRTATRRLCGSLAPALRINVNLAQPLIHKRRASAFRKFLSLVNTLSRLSQDLFFNEFDTQGAQAKPLSGIERVLKAVGFGDRPWRRALNRHQYFMGYLSD